VSYLGLPSRRQYELDQIPHGRTTGLHFCFAQSDLDEFKAKMKLTQRRRHSKGKSGR
jgi:hypothetical protein